MDFNLEEWVISAAQNYIEKHRNTNPDIAATVERLGALPLWIDWTGGVAIRPDGELIGFLWDDPHSAKVETDPHFRFLACVTGAERYAELALLLPTRTVHDRDCPMCNGTGRIGLEEHGIDPKAVRCYCGGVGWLPSNVPDPPRS